MKIVAVIPARMGSSRFPGKPLIKIKGIPMIEHVRRRVQEGRPDSQFELDDVFVATCDQEIKEAVESYGGKVIMTSDRHERATDRIEEAAHSFKADIIINVQGDEPLVLPESIDEVVSPFFKNKNVGCSCLMYPILSEKELHNDNIVKTVLNKNDEALYFSRAGIPGRSYDPNFKYYKQSGIMAFTKEFLHLFTKLESTPLEKKESVDLMRLLEHGYKVQGFISYNETKGVDIPAQVFDIERELETDVKQKAIFNSLFK